MYDKQLYMNNNVFYVVENNCRALYLSVISRENFDCGQAFILKEALRITRQS